MRAEYVWKTEYPIQLKAGLVSSLPSYELVNVSTSYCTSKTNTGQSKEISSVSLILYIRRLLLLAHNAGAASPVFILFATSLHPINHAGGCIEQQNICVTITLKLFQVMISWMSLWLDHTAVAARVTVGVTTLLIMTMQVTFS